MTNINWNDIGKKIKAIAVESNPAHSQDLDYTNTKMVGKKEYKVSIDVEDSRTKLVKFDFVYKIWQSDDPNKRLVLIEGLPNEFILDECTFTNKELVMLKMWL